jgi:large repetitive protein
MIKYLKTISVALLLMVCQSVFSGSGLLFNVSATGTPANVDITLCLNGKGPLSCQHYHVSALALSIRTTAPNHTYPAAGIIVNTPGYKIGNLGVDCTLYKNGYCLFSVSNTQSQTIYIAGGPALTANVQPANQTKNSGQSATLTVNASGGTAPYSYQWYSCTDSSCTTATTIAGETNSTYNPSTAATGTFYYRAVVADAVHAMVTTNVATLTVNNALSATVTSSSLVVDSGQTATFTANPIGGTAPFSYQWYSCTTSSCTTATTIAGETNNTYNPSTAATGTYYYRAVVGDATAAAATTNVATLSVNNALSATVTPSNLSANVGQMALLMANPTGGTAPYSYKWYSCNNASCTTATLISGATSNTYNPPTTAAGTYYYRATVTDSASTPVTATTNVATVMINGDLSVTVTPSNLSVSVGGSAQFTANPMAGTIPYGYQWYSCADSSCTSPTLIPGETNSTYNPPTTASGTFYYQAVVTDSATTPDTATSNVAALMVSSASQGSLTTLFTGGNGFAGNTFDVKRVASF